VRYCGFDRTFKWFQYSGFIFVTMVFIPLIAAQTFILYRLAGKNRENADHDADRWFLAG
jgi:hypothetical protein